MEVVLIFGGNVHQRLLSCPACAAHVCLAHGSCILRMCRRWRLCWLSAETKMLSLAWKTRNLCTHATIWPRNSSVRPTHSMSCIDLYSRAYGVWYILAQALKQTNLSTCVRSVSSRKQCLFANLHVCVQAGSFSAESMVPHSRLYVVPVSLMFARTFHVMWRGSGVAGRHRAGPGRAEAVVHAAESTQTRI